MKKFFVTILFVLVVMSGFAMSPEENNKPFYNGTDTIFMECNISWASAAWAMPTTTATAILPYPTLINQYQITRNGDVATDSLLMASTTYDNGYLFPIITLTPFSTLGVATTTYISTDIKYVRISNATTAIILTSTFYPYLNPTTYQAMATTIGVNYWKVIFHVGQFGSKIFYNKLGIVGRTKEEILQGMPNYVTP